MNKIVLADVLGPRRYAAVRDKMRRRVIELKRARRVPIGPQLTLVFENRATVGFQIEEMCLAENLEDPARIQGEIDVYNRILPDAGELAATLLIEVVDQRAVEATLERLVGLNHHLWLLLGERAVQARFDPEQFEADRLAAVQYLRFPVEAAASELRRAPSDVRLRIDHANYRYETRLSEQTQRSLAEDLT